MSLLRARLWLVMCLMLAARDQMASRMLAGNEHADRHGDPLPEGAILRIGTVRYRAGASINKAALSPDGKLLAAASESGITLIELATGEPRYLRGTNVPNGFGTNVSILAFSADGKQLVNVTTTGNLRVLDVASGKTVRSLGKDVQQPPRVGFAPQPLPAQDRGWVQVWVPSLGDSLLVSSRGNQVLRLEPKSGKVVQQFAIGGELASVAQDGKTLAVIDSKRSEVILHGPDGKELRRLAHTGGVYLAALDHEGKLLVTANEGAEIRVWDARTGNERRRLQARAPTSGSQFLTVAALSLDEKVLFAGTKKGEILRWNLVTGKELEPLRGHRNWLTGLFLPPGDQTLVSVAWDGVVRRWNLTTGKALPDAEGYCSHVAVARSPDGRSIGAADSSGQVEIWNARRGERVRVLRPAGSPVSQLCFSRDSKWLAVGQGDYSVSLLDTGDGREVRKFELLPQSRQRDAWFAELAFSPDGRSLVSSEYADGTRLWQIMTGKEVWHIPEKGKAAFSPDGKTMVTGGFDSRLVFRETETGKERFALERQEIIDSIVFSPDGRILATSHHGGTIYLRDPATGSKRKTLQGHQEVAWMVSFSQDSKWLASSGDRTVRVWDVATGKEVLCLNGHEGRAYQAEFGPDGRTVLSSSLDLTALLWSIRPRPERGRSRTFETLWADLAGEPAAAYRAIWAIVDEPKASSAFLRQKIGPVKIDVDQERVHRLLKDLDSTRFQERAAASRALAELGVAVEGELRVGLQGAKSAEVRNRIEKLLDGLKQEPTIEDLRRSRAIQALELSGAPEAVAVLREWATGTAYALLTRDARASVARLGKPLDPESKPRP